MQEFTQADISLRELVQGIKQDHFGFLQRLIDQYGLAFSYAFKAHQTFVILDPKMIRHILVTNKDNYIKGAEISGTSFNYIKAAIGESIFLTDNQKLWAKHRSILMPHLQRSHYNEYAKTIVQNAQTYVDQLQNTSVNQPINFSDLMPELTLKNLLTSLLQDKNFDYKTLLEFTHLIKATDRQVSFKELVHIFDDLAAHVVKQHLAQNGEAQNLIHQFKHAYENETDSEYVFKLIKDELKGLLIAGHETVAVCLMWSCYLLAQHPDVQEQIRNEYCSQFKETLPTYSDLEKLPYTMAVVKESLRLFPPVYTISRVAVDDDLCEDFYIPSHGYIMIPVYHLHRHPKFWSEPNTFDIQRFYQKNYTEEDLPAYIPFGLGQRACIGREFALMEACLTLAMIFSKFKFSLAKDFRLELNAVNSLWPKSPVQLCIEKKWND